MNVHLYERLWMWAAVAIIALFIGTIGVATFGQALRPPSHVETIDPSQVFTDPRFAQPGVTRAEGGRWQVNAVLTAFAFLPADIEVTAGDPVTFTLTSIDVTHGFQIVATNGNTMVVPGYVSRFTTTFERPGEYLIVCNEYCGTGHHTMQGKLVVRERQP